MGKACKRCGVHKELNEYYRHSQMKDGYLNICISCKLAYSQAYRTQNIDKVRAYDRARDSCPDRVHARKEYIARLKEEEPVRYAKMRLAATKKYRGKNGKKAHAHTKVNNSLSAGKIAKPAHCSICGRNGKLEGHHADYPNPLQVQWLCPSCHKELHTALRESRRGA